MTCADFQELVALYALDALETGDRAAADTHLAAGAHEGCLEALAGARAGAEAMARALPPERPPPALWRAIEARLPARQRAAPRWREPLAWLAAAAAVIALFFLQGAHRRELRAAASRELQLARDGEGNAQRAAECRKDLEALRTEGELQKAALALLQSPSARLVSLAPQPGADAAAHATALVDVSQRQGIVLTGAGQLRVPQGQVAELWLIRGSAAPIPAGLLRASASGALLAQIDPALLAPGAPDALAISFEPGPGPSSAPTTVVLVGALSKT